MRHAGMLFALPCLLANLACGGSNNPATQGAKPEAPAAAEAGPSPAPAPATKPVAKPAEDTPAKPAAPIPCGDTTCTPPQECITVVGSLPGSQRQECWIPCGEGGRCPDGFKCTMIHDGPGEVCDKIEAPE